MQLSKQVSFLTFGLTISLVVLAALAWKNTDRDQQAILDTGAVLFTNGEAIEGLFKTGLFVHKWFLNPDFEVNIEEKINGFSSFANQVNLPQADTHRLQFINIQNQYLDFYKNEGQVTDEESLKKLREITFFSADYIDQLKKENRSWQKNKIDQVALRMEKIKIGAVGILVFFVTIFLYVGLIVNRRLSTSLSSLKKAASAIKSGKYTEKINIKGNNEFSKITESFNDLTENLQQSEIIKGQNDQLEKLNKELSLKNDSLDSFVYRVSHDLKAPLINLTSLIKVIKAGVSKYDDPKLERPLEFMQSNSEKLNKTIHDLLKVNRIERSLKKKKKLTSIISVLKEVQMDQVDAIDESDTVFDIQLSVTEIYFSKTNLKNILSNLISNSIKFRNQKNHNCISIRSEQLDNFIQLSISDNGIGIDVKKHERKLFGIFNRFHNHVEGSGVGLYIVKKTMEENGGNISIESTVNKGTSLRLNFPALEEDNENEITSEMMIMN